MVSALTDARGEFVLEDVPSDAAVPLVVDIGRFRRTATISIAPCVETRIADEAVRLPRSSAEGDLPFIAVTTGASDALECLLRNIGIDDREFTGGDDETGRVHIYRGKGGGGLPNRPIPFASDLWNDPARLQRYDIVALSCEGSEANENKGGDEPAARGAIRAYANSGGQVFATHFQYTWLKGSPGADFRDLATWDPSEDIGDEYAIDTGFPKGRAFADWLLASGASTSIGRIRLDNVAFSIGTIKEPPAQGWIRKPETGRARYFSFNTPVGAAREAQCGRTVFADLHAFGLGGSDFPTGCLAPRTSLSAQQLALEFLLFDAFACVDDDREAPVPPR